MLRPTCFTLNFLAVLFAFELALHALDKGDHVGLGQEVNLGLEDLLVRVLVATLEEVEQREHEVSVEVLDDAGQELIRRRVRRGGNHLGGL